MSDLIEAVKAYHHAFAAFQRAGDEWLTGLPQDDGLLTATSEVVAAHVRVTFPEEIEAMRVAHVQLDVLRERDQEKLVSAAIAAHEANERTAREATTAWLERAMLTRSLRAVEETNPEQEAPQ